MNEVSLILKNQVLVSIEEFRILDRLACSGRIWTVIHTHPNFITRQRTIEYIFDPEALTIFRIVSQNVLATWQTDVTKYLGPDDEYKLKDSLFIRPYLGRHL